MALSRTHYQNIARIIEVTAPDNGLLVSELALYLKEDNPRFDRERFITACGVA